VWMDQLPTLPNGKVNRHGLPPAPVTRPDLDAPFAAPRTSTEGRLASIWEDILSIHDVGVHDPFFELGGDSLQATRVLSRIADAFGVELRQADIFATPTIAALAALIDERAAGG